MAEFSDSNTIVIYRYSSGTKRVTMRELLPDGFAL
jgi:cytidine deaminase